MAFRSQPFSSAKSTKNKYDISSDEEFLKQEQSLADLTTLLGEETAEKIINYHATSNRSVIDIVDFYDTEF